MVRNRQHLLHCISSHEKMRRSDSTDMVRSSEEMVKDFWLSLYLWFVVCHTVLPNWKASCAFAFIQTIIHSFCLFPSIFLSSSPSLSCCLCDETSLIKAVVFCPYCVPRWLYKQMIISFQSVHQQPHPLPLYRFPLIIVTSNLDAFTFTFCLWSR